MKLFEKWYYTRIDSNKNKHKSRVISLFYYKQHFLLFNISNNRAKKGIDKCFDFSIWFLGFNFNYTNFDYDK